MAAYVKFVPFVEAAFEKKHNLATDSLVYWLSNTAPAASNAVLTDITQISYTNLSARAATVSSSSTNGSNEYVLVLADKVLTASGAVATFRYVGVYNDTATNDDLVGGYYDYGVGGVTLANGETFTIDHDPTNGFFKVA